MKINGEGRDWSDLLSSYRKILKNISFLGVTGACTSSMAFTSIISMYGIQYLTEVYHVPHANSTVIFRLNYSTSTEFILNYAFSMSLSTVLLALPISGYLSKGINKTKMRDLKKTLRFMRLCSGIGGTCLLSLLMTCNNDEVLFAGGDVGFNDLNLEANWIQSNSSKYYQFNNEQLYGYCSLNNNIDPKCPCGTDEYIPICAKVNT